MKGETGVWRPVAKAELDCGVECRGGSCLRVSKSESEKCELWGM